MTFERVLAEIYLIIIGQHKIDFNMPLLAAGALVVLVLYGAIRIAFRTQPMMPPPPYAVIQMPSPQIQQNGGWLSGCATGVLLLIAAGVIAILVGYAIVSQLLVS